MLNSTHMGATSAAIISTPSWHQLATAFGAGFAPSTVRSQKWFTAPAANKFATYANYTKYGKRGTWSSIG
jgi:hypothetical protein